MSSIHTITKQFLYEGSHSQKLEYKLAENRQTSAKDDIWFAGLGHTSGYGELHTIQLHNRV